MTRNELATRIVSFAADPSTQYRYSELCIDLSDEVAVEKMKIQSLRQQQYVTHFISCRCRRSSHPIKILKSLPRGILISVAAVCDLLNEGELAWGSAYFDVICYDAGWHFVRGIHHSVEKSMVG